MSSYNMIGNRFNDDLNLVVYSKETLTSRDLLQDDLFIPK